LDTGEARREKHSKAFENEYIKKLLRIQWTKLMTTLQVYKMAETENELLNHFKSRKLQFCRPHDNSLIDIKIINTNRISILISTKTRLMKALVWPVATYSSESWTLRKNEETHLDAFEIKGLRKILQVS